MIGTVKWFNDSKGYGYLSADTTDRDIFVHYTAMLGDGYQTLVEGQGIEFELIDGPKGPQAANVVKCVTPCGHKHEVDNA